MTVMKNSKAGSDRPPRRPQQQPRGLEKCNLDQDWKLSCWRKVNDLFQLLFVHMHCCSTLYTKSAGRSKGASPKHLVCNGKHIVQANDPFIQDYGPCILFTVYNTYSFFLLIQVTKHQTRVLYSESKLLPSPDHLLLHSREIIFICEKYSYVIGRNFEFDQWDC